MTLTQPKKVNYSANQRLDLVDKVAEYTTGDDNLNQTIKALITDSPDGRVFSGWRTTTVNGSNAGFTIAAEQASALDRAGNLLLLDGSAALTVALSQNVINYVHAYYAETPSDPDTRRFYSSGGEVLQTTNTRVTRTPNLYKTTGAYGSGTPVYGIFAQTALVGGKTVQLMPLYAVAVDNTNTITAVVDYRPMFAVGIGAAGNNQYQAASGNVDLPFNFAPATNVATLSVISIRRALVALCDRLQQIKGTTNWYDDAANQLRPGTYSYTSFNQTTNTTTVVGPNSITRMPFTSLVSDANSVIYSSVSGVTWQIMSQSGPGGAPSISCLTLSASGVSGTGSSSPTGGISSVALVDAFLTGTLNPVLSYASYTGFIFKPAVKLQNNLTHTGTFASLTNLSETASREYLTDLHNFSYYGSATTQVAGLYVLFDQYVQVDPGSTGTTSIVMATINGPVGLVANTLRLAFTALSNTSSAVSIQYNVILYSQPLGSPSQTVVLTSGTITSTNAAPATSGQANTTPEVKDFALGGITLDPVNFRYMVKIQNTSGSGSGPAMRLYKVALVGTAAQFGGVV